MKATVNLLAGCGILLATADQTALAAVHPVGASACRNLLALGQSQFESASPRRLPSATMQEPGGPGNPPAPYERSPQPQTNPAQTNPYVPRPDSNPQRSGLAPPAWFPNGAPYATPRQADSGRGGAYRPANPQSGGTFGGYPLPSGAPPQISFDPNRPLASQQNRPAGPSTGQSPAKREVLSLLARARVALDRGDVQAARQLIEQAEARKVPDRVFGPNEPRPWQLRLELDRIARRREGSPQRAAYATLGADPGNHGPYPVQRSVYDPRRDTTRTVPANAQLPGDGESSVLAQPSEGRRLFDLGMKTLLQDREAARKHFEQAWQFRDELDPLTRQRLQDQLVLLGARRPAPAPREEPSPLDAVAAKEVLNRQKIFRDVSLERAAADKMLRSDPRQALDRLQKLRTRVHESQLDPGARKHLLALVERSIRDAEGYIQNNLAQIELDERNQGVREQIDREQRVKLEVQDKLAEFVEEFNTLLDERRFAEAEVVAKKARELDPTAAVVQTMMWKSRFVRTLASQMSIRERKEAGFLGALEAVDDSSVPFDDRNPMVFGDVREWEAITGRRRQWLEQHRNRLNPAEIEIQESLKQQVKIRFDKTPLAAVMQALAEEVGINVYLDQEGMHAEGVTSDTPVTINLTQPISMRSALNLILEPLRLSYVIQNEVLRITSEQNRDTNTYALVYNVADLVIPIPNFIHTGDAGLPRAIREAHRALGYGIAAPTAGGGALTVAADNQFDGASGNSSVLAQMVGSGMVPSPGRRSSRPIDVGPNGMGGFAQADFDSLIDLITSTVAPQTWEDVGGPGSLSGFETNLSLVVSQTQEVHEQIADLLEQLRRLQDLQITIEVRFITLNDTFFERIGIDFDFDIDDNVTDDQFFNAISSPGDSGPGVTVGLSQPTISTPAATDDLDIQFRQGSFASAVPQFGGFDAMTAANFGVAILSDIEVFMFIEASQGDQRTNILQAPKVTLFNGQSATISDTSQTPFVTSVIPVVGDFAAAQQPVIVVLNEGTSMNVQAVASQDRRFVRLTLVPFFSSIGDVREFTFNGKTTTVSGTNVLDAAGDNILGTDNVQTVTEGTTVQLPTFNFTTVSTTVSVPDGGTVLLGGIKRLREGRTERGVPMLDKLPYVSRLFKNVGIGRETSSLMMMVTPRIIIQEEEEEKTVGRPLQ